MNIESAKFPFGQSVRIVEQDLKDRGHRELFVLGVYASAVHARWIDAHGKTLVTALAVASEPYIFWHGEDAEAIISEIQIPDELGKLVPAAKTLNGPSGCALDELFLDPLGLDRPDAWLCDLVPHSCMNPGQKKAIEQHYTKLVKDRPKLKLTPASVPGLPHPLVDSCRAAEIVAEIEACNPCVIMLLGDEPVRWFQSQGYFDKKFRTLAAFGQDDDSYGRLHPAMINDKQYCVLPLAHPRQAKQLGAHSEKWFKLHSKWAADPRSMERFREALESGCGPVGSER